MKANGMANGKWEMAKMGIHHLTFAFCLLPFAMMFSVAAAPAGSYFDRGAELYKAGRNSDAIDAFLQAIKHKDRAQQAQGYIDRIRKETVERIRNKALTGINKATWQNAYYFMNEVDHRIHVGISVQEVFERDSVNFRPGAIDALSQLAAAFAKAETAQFDVELINELNAEAPPDPTLTAQQENAVFSYLSLASRDVLPKF
jgi:tetratricopeptide (TPR) repeat protein